MRTSEGSFDAGLSPYGQFLDVVVVFPPAQSVVETSDEKLLSCLDQS
jgi:hypothetical protein